MPITKTVVVSHVLIGIEGNLKTGAARFVFERFEDDVSVRNDIALECPAEDFVPMLQKPIPADKAGYPLGYYLADEVMEWAIAKGYLSGQVS